MTTQDKQGLSANEREIVAMLAEPPVSQGELFALCRAAKKIIDRLSSTGAEAKPRRWPQYGIPSSRPGLTDADLDGMRRVTFPPHAASHAEAGSLLPFKLRQAAAWLDQPPPPSVPLADMKSPSRMMRDAADEIDRLSRTQQAPASGELRDVLEQIIAVADDNAPDGCNKKMALAFVRDVASKALSAQPFPATAEGDYKPQNLANGQPRAASELSAKIKELSEKATAGKWLVSRDKKPIVLSDTTNFNREGHDKSVDLEFMVALVNAYRAGDLVAHGNQNLQAAESMPTTPTTDGTGQRR